jgi:hypothetical protein
MSAKYLGGDVTHGNLAGKGASGVTCCWIILATTGCSTDAASRGAVAGAPADCCWILLATTGCSTDTAGPPGLAAINVAADCCWILVATTGCSTDSLGSSASVAKAALAAAPAADCCWILLATTGCST